MKSDRSCFSVFKKSLWSLSALVLLLASGCGKSEAPAQGPTALLAEDGQPEDTIDDANQRPSGPGQPGQGLGTPAWGGGPDRRAWANAVLGVVRSRMGDLEKARDKDIFCPGYANASASQRANCWLMLIAAVSKFESNFKPASTFREPDGRYSVGMLALSPGECTNAPSLRQLQAAVPNLVCGTHKMAGLIARYGYIDGPASARGASRYWSTLRAPYKRWDPSRNRYLYLGKRNLILPLVRGFRGRSSLSGVGDPLPSAREESDEELGIDGYGYHDESTEFDSEAEE